MSDRRRRWYQRPAILALLALIELVLLFGNVTALEALRQAGFDAWQRLQPRERVNDSVVIVAIDDASLARLGQWPWPRSQIAQLVERIAAAEPAALAVDAVFAEPDRLSPPRLAARFEAGGSPEVAAALRRLPDSDLQLSRALASLPSVLGAGGLEAEPGLTPGAPYAAPVLQSGGDAQRFVKHYAAVLRSIDIVDQAATGHGLLNAADASGVVRRVPTLASIDGRLLPGLAVETLRVAANEPALRVTVGRDGVAAVEIADRRIPTQANGDWLLHFSDPRERPHLSAADVLEGIAPVNLLMGRIVLLGYTALGLQDNVLTPLGRMPGVEAHAEAIDNLLDGRLLQRPRWALGVEGLLMALMAIAAMSRVPRATPPAALAALALTALVVGGASFAAFSVQGWLIDAVNPLLGAALVFAAMLATTLGEAQAQRRRLRDALAASRERQARMEGEMDAARRIQMGMLPKAEALIGNDPRLDIAAHMQPARSVGGDLYDFVRLDADTVFVLIGDVSGKGLPASLFMALAKALTKGFALGGDADPGRVLSAAGAAMALENPEAMFVSVVAATLDLRSGRLRWCSAGHEPPARLGAAPSPVWLEGVGGPPLCVIDGFEYRSETLQLAPGDALCLITDGVTEAQNAKGEFYGAARLNPCLERLRTQAPPAQDMVTAIERDVAAFVGEAEAADDLTVLVLRWRQGGRAFSER